MRSSSCAYVPIALQVGEYVSTHIKTFVAVIDILLLPICFMTKWLSEIMLATNNPCEWTKYGLRCGTCGGTHCVSAFMSGKLGEAFTWNPIVFAGICYGLVSILLLNAGILGKMELANKVLKKMYSLPVFFVSIGAYIAFTILRNVFSI